MATTYPAPFAANCLLKAQAACLAHLAKATSEGDRRFWQADLDRVQAKLADLGLVLPTPDWRPAESIPEDAYAV